MWTPVWTPVWTVDGITFEAELRLDVAPGRIIWLQQWIAGAFDYLDNSILAAVVRGVSDLSISRAWSAGHDGCSNSRARTPASLARPRLFTSRLPAYPHCTRLPA